MKNLTEFPGFLLRKASAVRREKLQELLAVAKAAAPISSEAPEPTNSAETTELAGSTAPAAETVSESGVAEAATAEDTAVEATGEASTDGNSDIDPSAEDSEKVADAKNTDADISAKEDGKNAEAGDKSSNDAKPDSDKPEVDEEALAAAVGEAMKIADERLGYLMGALRAVGRKGIDRVRQVRVFKGEDAPAGAFSIDDIHFVVDRIATPAKENSRGGKGGRDSKGRGRDNKGGGNKGRGGGGGGAGGGGGGAGGGGYAGKGGRGFDSMAKDERPGDVPSGGLGWSLERAPGSDKDKRGGGRGKPGRKGPRRGKPGGKPGEKRNEGRKPRTDRKAPMPEVVVKAKTVAPSDN